MSRNHRAEFAFKNNALKMRTEWEQSTASERMGKERADLPETAGTAVNNFRPGSARNLGFSVLQNALREFWNLKTGGEGVRLLFNDFHGFQANLIRTHQSTQQNPSAGDEQK
ncbi:hypothetical protein [Shumkonia mesophila]|uniref:hypothetical protein n=1 Tax=Shumkonia mesophila TaxID=2838854 RepID=UPI002934AEE3|nr:hypothetical protein [Shumkonia mesophila]